jgi:superfamily II DNA/RNA helicase
VKELIHRSLHGVCALFCSALQTAFEELGVMPEIIRAIDEMGWLLPRPVQTETIPLVLGGGDVLAVCSEF